MRNPLAAQSLQPLIDELRMKVYPKDTSAIAVVLSEKGEAYVDGYNGTKLIVSRRIKILKKKGIDEFGQFVRYIFAGKISKITGTTYNLEDGVIVPSEIDTDLVYKGHHTKSVNDLHVAFSKVKVGSVIEYNYTVRFDYITFPSWFFQTTIPVIFSEYTLYNPLRSRFKFEIDGDQPLAIQETLIEDKKFRWVMTNIPAFHVEPLMPYRRKISSIYFAPDYNQTPASWEKVRELFLHHVDFTGIIAFKEKKLNTVADSIVAIYSNPIEVISAISNYVKSKVTWNGHMDCLAGKPLDILKKKQGSSGDIILLMLSLLFKANLNVSTILLSTREHGEIDQNKPSPNRFNYVIGLVSLGDKFLLVDATDKLLPYNEIPQYCANVMGFLITPEGFEWVAVTVNQKSKTSTTLTLNPSPTGDLKAEVTISKYGFTAHKARSIASIDGEKELFNEFSQGNRWSIGLQEFRNENEIEKPTIEKYEVETDEGILISDTKIYIDPFIFNKRENPFKEEKRKYPIDFEVKYEDIVLCTVIIPKGYKVETLPANLAITLPQNDVKFSISYTQSKDSVMVARIMQINKTVFSPDEYVALREFFNRMVDKDREPLVLMVDTLSK